MIVQLIRHTFPDDPDWIIVNKTVPIGTRYEVEGYFHDGFRVVNLITRETRDVEVYFLVGNGDKGFLPTICFEPVSE